MPELYTIVCNPRRGAAAAMGPRPPRAPLLAVAGPAGSVRALAWSPDGSRLASAGDDGVVWLWEIGDKVRPGPTIHQFLGGGWCTLGPDGRPLGCAGEVWRWLRWRDRDPVTGASILLPAEYFGALPGLPQPV